jgi:hypothetical protein
LTPSLADLHSLSARQPDLKHDIAATLFLQSPEPVRIPASLRTDAPESGPAQGSSHTVPSANSAPKGNEIYEAPVVEKVWSRLLGARAACLHVIGWSSPNARSRSRVMTLLQRCSCSRPSLFLSLRLRGQTRPRPARLKAILSPLPAPAQLPRATRLRFHLSSRAPSLRPQLRNLQGLPRVHRPPRPPRTSLRNHSRRSAPRATSQRLHRPNAK